MNDTDFFYLEELEVFQENCIFKEGPRIQLSQENGQKSLGKKILSLEKRL